MAEIGIAGDRGTAAVPARSFSALRNAINPTTLVALLLAAILIFLVANPLFQLVKESFTGSRLVVVAVEDRVKHALYGKVLRRTNNLKAHDETNEVGIGDRVLIMETRPLSATKRWRVVEVIEKAK